MTATLPTACGYGVLPFNVCLYQSSRISLMPRSIDLTYAKVDHTRAAQLLEKNPSEMKDEKKLYSSAASDARM